MNAATPDLRGWTGLPVADRSSNGVGVVADVYLGRGTREPEFVLVDTGGGRQAIIPLTDAEIRSGTLFVNATADQVAAAPPADGSEELTPDREAELYAFYGHQPRALPPEQQATHVSPPPEQAPPPQPQQAETAELTRSEEQLFVNTEAQVRERVTVRKRVVTEEVTVTIPLRREELVVERHPIEPGTAEAPPDAQPVEAEFDFVLLAEQPVIEKRLVPVEQVRVRKDVVVEEEILSDELRKERIDVEELPPTP